MSDVRIHCYGCGATLPVAERWMAYDLRRAGWAIARGETYCGACAQTRGLATAADGGEEASSAEPGRRRRRVPVVGVRRLIVVLASLSASVVGVLVAGLLVAAGMEVFRNSSGLRAGEVITLTALMALGVWLPLSIWRAGNWIARLGMKMSCPGCGERVAVGRRRCACGEWLRPIRENPDKLESRPRLVWPIRYAPIGFAISVAIWLTSGALLNALGVRLSVLLGVVLVDISLVGVALALTRRVAPPRPWQFGLRETSLALGARTTLVAYGSLMVANVAYLLLFGPFTVENAHFIADAEPAGLIVGAVLFAPLAEEFFFRGFIYGTLRRRLSRPQAAAATSAMFVSAHWLSGYPGWALVPIAFFSVAACLVYETTGSIWPCIALHAANNASLFASPAVGALTLCAIVVAGVATLQSPRSDRGGSRSWLIPSVAGAVSAALLVMAGAFAGPSQPAVVQAAARLRPAGFAAGTTTPAAGSWVATGIPISATGYGNIHVGELVHRRWQISRCATDSACSYLITVQTRLGPLTAPLVREAGGWRVSLPPQTLPCGERNGVEIGWQQHAALVIRFTQGGLFAEARERIFSFAAQCGYATALRQWHAVAEGP
jgi:membrane protease YdiL (CAAX protease family)